MPMDGLTLGFAARELKETLAGGRIDKVNQPERDELILTIRNHGANHQLLISTTANNARIHLTQLKKISPLEPPMFCVLLRKHLISGRVSDIRQCGGDRILEIDVEVTDELGDRVTRTLVLELMGKHSNVMLLRPDGRIIDSARHITEEISRVREVLPGLPYKRPPAQDKLPYDSLDAARLRARLEACAGPLHRALADCITGLGALSARELAYRATGDELTHTEACDLGSVAESVARTLGALPGEFRPALLLSAHEADVEPSKDGAALDFVAFPHRCRAGLSERRTGTLSEAMETFYRARDQVDRMLQKSSALHRVLKNNIERCEKKLALQLEALEGAGRMDEYRTFGELITASQHLLKKGMREAMLPNYYDENMAEITVQLDEKLSPAENAQRYFKLYQKARSAQLLAKDQKQKTEEELAYLEGQMENLAKCTEESDLNEIRQELEKEGYVRSSRNRRQMKALPPSQPLHYLSSAGLDILVGKNNLQNEKLTQTAGPAETWLHAKDMPGSHVIIASDDVDRQSLMEAALLAAHYSKGRGGSQVPVDYTLRKYVKKPSGAKPGYVIYTHQKTLFVTPEEEEIRRLRQA